MLKSVMARAGQVTEICYLFCICFNVVSIQSYYNSCCFIVIKTALLNVMAFP